MIEIIKQGVLKGFQKPLNLQPDAEFVWVTTSVGPDGEPENKYNETYPLVKRITKDQLGMIITPTRLNQSRIKYYDQLYAREGDAVARRSAVDFIGEVRVNLDTLTKKSSGQTDLKIAAGEMWVPITNSRGKIISNQPNGPADYLRQRIVTLASIAFTQDRLSEIIFDIDKYGRIACPEQGLTYNQAILVLSFFSGKDGIQISNFTRQKRAAREIILDVVGIPNLSLPGPRAGRKQS